jgi:hypothetical protein
MPGGNALERWLHQHFPVSQPWAFRLRCSLYGVRGLAPVSSRFTRRIIYDRDGAGPYLARFYLSEPPTMADGSSPFRDDGGLRSEARTRRKWIGTFVHYFYRGDDDEALHNHPWRWAVSLILTGGYIEERRTKDMRVVRRVVRPGSINIITQNTFHRVELLDPERGAWTLFIAGPKVSSWGFWDPVTHEFLHWREFIDRKRAA